MPKGEKSGWAAKQAKKAEFAENKMLDTGGDNIDSERTESRDTRAVSPRCRGKGGTVLQLDSWLVVRGAPAFLSAFPPLSRPSVSRNSN